MFCSVGAGGLSVRSWVVEDVPPRLPLRAGRSV